MAFPRRFNFFLIAGVFVLHAVTLSQTGNQVDTEQLAAMEMKAYSGKQRPLLSNAQNNYDIFYTRCNWKVDPNVNYIRGDITTYFKPESPGFNVIEFDLSHLLTVDSVVYHGLKISFLHQNTHLLRITLPGTVAMGSRDSVTVYYQGVPSPSGLGSFSKSTHGSDPIIWTLSEPYGARDWWPCKQNLADKIDSIDIWVTCPQTYKVASNGLLISESVSGTDKTCHWKSRYPITTYLVAIAVTNYVSFTQVLSVPSGTVPIVNYVYPENLSSALMETEGIIDIMKLYDSLLIPYPFSAEKYGHAQFGWGGGMEHQTMSFMYGFDYSLMAHECAHQWFGDHVTCGSWQEIWLNEGFATYLEGLTLERYKPANWAIWKSSKVRGITSQADGSVFCRDTTNNVRIFDSRLTYDKGAYLLRMLRWKLGTRAFFNGLKNYLSDPQTAGKFGKTTYLKSHLEASSGKNLTRFFDQWYYNEGYPSYDVVWKKVGNTVTVTIEQKTSHPSVSFFEMPVPIKFSGPDKDTLLAFDHTYSGQQFTCTIPFEISWAEFDPDLQLISRNNHVAVLFELSSDPDLIKLFPNPVDKSLYIKMMVDAERINTIEITDVLGKKITEISVPGSQNNYELDVSSLDKAFYYLTVKTTRKRYYSKFLKL